jgi:hypothetical protein
MWVGTATTDSAGNLTTDYAIAGFTGVHVIQVQAVSSGADVTETFAAFLASSSATAMSGFARAGVNDLTFGPTLVPAPSGIPIQIIAIGG